MALALVITTAIGSQEKHQPLAAQSEENKLQWVGTEGNVALQNVRLISAAPMRSRSPRWLGTDITRKKRVDHTFLCKKGYLWMYYVIDLFSPPVPIIPSISASNTE
ncbi:hypothetical protein ACJX0J_033307 [Zea mays]